MLQDVVDYYSKNKMSFDEPFRIRIHRALSWFKKAKELNLNGELDLSFITMWIGFNAAYGQNLNSAFKLEKTLINDFLNQILLQDHKNEIGNILWNHSSKAIISLLENKYTLEKYWHYVNGKEDASNWNESLQRSVTKGKILIEKKSAPDELLSMILHRFYSLRNQLLHGGATFESILNRNQIEDALQLMFGVFPVIVQLMMETPDKSVFGEPYYKPIKE